jgi:hypothetical protein
MEVVETVKAEQKDKCERCVYFSRLLKRCVLRKCRKATTIVDVPGLVDGKYPRYGLRVEKE